MSKDEQQHRLDCLREPDKISRACPNLHYQTVKGALVIEPSKPRIQPAQFRLVDG